MIDLHCHVLPALDDGALNLDDSVAMARQAVADGISVICATPHVRHDHDVVIAGIAARVNEVNERLDREDVPVRVLAGAEVAETAARDLDDEELSLATLGRGRWILLEPAPGPLSDSLQGCVEHLAARGYRSLIAHPERHPVEDMAVRLERLIQRGALVQVTAAFLADEPADGGLIRLAHQGLVHVLGSDAHSSHGGRPVRLSEGLARLEGDPLLLPYLAWIARNAPRAIVRGEELRAPFAPAAGSTLAPG